MSTDEFIAADMAEFGLDAVDFLLERTKQVRLRLDTERPVPREVILECIDIASRAPIGGNVEVNRWIVVDDPTKRKALADIYNSYATDYLAAGKEGVAAVPDGPVKERAERVVRSSEFFLEHLADVPVHVIPVRPSAEAITTVFDQATFWGSVLPGVWSLQLALRSRGIGSAWTTLHLANHRDAAELLGIPDGIVQTALIPVAFFKGDTFHPAPRRAAKDVTYFNTWGEKSE